MSGCDMFDLDNEEEKSNYTFAFSGDERNINFNVAVDYDGTWNDVLRHFLDFLGSVYGYNISKYVTMESPRGFKGLKDDEDTTA